MFVFTYDESSAAYFDKDTSNYFLITLLYLKERFQLILQSTGLSVLIKLLIKVILLPVGEWWAGGGVKIHNLF